MIVEELVTTLGLEIKDTGLAEFKSSLLATAGRLALVTAGAVAAAAAVSAVFGAVAQAAKEVSDGAKLARNLGTTSQELQRLGQVAESVGLPISSLQGIIESLRVNLLKVPKGNSPFEAALGAMGISARDSSGKLKDAIPLFKEISDVIANAGDLQDFRLGQAFEVIGENASAIELLKLGSDEIERRMATFKALSDKDIDRFERLTATLQRLNNVAKTFGLKLASPIASFMDQVLGSMEKAAESKAFDKVVEQFEKISKAAGKFFTKTVEESAPQVEKVQRLAEDMVKKTFGVKELSGGQTAIAMLLTGLLSATPQGPSAAADIQDFREGKSGTRTQAELEAISGFFEDLVSFGTLSSFRTNLVDPLATGDTGSGSGLGRGDVHIHNENHFSPGTDIPAALRALDRTNAEEVRDAVDNPKRRVR